MDEIWPNTTDYEELLLEECSAVNLLNSTFAQCEFIRNRPECNGHGGLFNYIELFYCSIGAMSKASPLVLASLILLVLFIGLGITADDFLCPALLVISSSLKLSQNVAGVTFLAFGNGAPDIFSSMAGIRHERPHLVLGELFGAGIFVTTVVAGAIFLTKPFKSMERPLLRDILFYMLATFLTWCIFYSGRIELWQSVAFILIYVAYIVVVIVGRILYNRQKNGNNGVAKIAHTNEAFVPTDEEEAESRIRSPSNMTSLEVPKSPFAVASQQIVSSVEGRPTTRSPSSARPSLTISASGEGSPSHLTPDSRPRTLSHSRYLIHNHFNNALFSITHNVNEDGSCQDINCLASASLKHDAVASYQSYVTAVHSAASSRSGSFARSRATSVASQESHLKTIPEWQDFLVHVCPVDFLNWQDMSWLSKAFQIIKAPLYFLLVITTPVVDYESHKQNWCRWLNCLHCITGPIMVLILTGKITVTWGGFPVAVLALLIGAAVALAVFLTSKHEGPPKYQTLFGYLGFLVSVVWIYAMANEVVDLLQAIGFMFNLSDSILGLTVLAWGNSIGDLVSNVSMAKQGFPRMAISACFGGPLLNLLLGIGLPYTFMLSESGTGLKLVYTRMTSLLYGAVTLGLMSTVVFLMINNFETKKSHGIFLILMYLLYMTIAVLVESEVI